MVPAPVKALALLLITSTWIIKIVAETETEEAVPELRFILPILFTPLPPIVRHAVFVLEESILQDSSVKPAVLVVVKEKKNLLNLPTKDPAEAELVVDDPPEFVNSLHFILIVPVLVLVNNEIPVVPISPEQYRILMAEEAFEEE